MTGMFVFVGGLIFQTLCTLVDVREERLTSKALIESMFDRNLDESLPGVVKRNDSA